MEATTESSLEEKISEVRDYVNSPWIQFPLLVDKIKWDKVCASMDVIEDAQAAMDHYKSLEDFDADSGGYLYIYGLLQALQMQQDALKNLHRSLFDTDLSLAESYPKLNEIRRIRNAAVGHPTKNRNDESFHHISQRSICKGGFDLASYYPKTGNKEFGTVNLTDLIAQQERFATSILADAVRTLNDKWMEHKQKFKGKPLVSLIPASFRYHVSKLHEGVRRNYPVVKVDYNVIRKSLDEIRDGIAERYGALDAVDDIKYDVDELYYILNRLGNWIEANEMEGNGDARVFIDCLGYKFEDFKKRLSGIDGDFS